MLGELPGPQGLAHMCWSADEEFVVHTYWLYTHLVVVPTGVSQR